MKKPYTALFWIATVGMEISAIYAWTDFVLTATTQFTYPLTEAAAVFVASSVLVSIARNWRSIRGLSFHTVALGFLVIRNAHVLWYGSVPFWGGAWVSDLLGRGRTPAAWASLALFCAWTVVFWISGGAYALRSKSYPAVCDRFDKGLTWLFVLMFAKFLIRVPIGAQLTENISDWMIFPFFFFGVMAVALARNRNEAQKRFLSGFRGIGIVVSFSAAIILGGCGLLLLFVPYLRAASVAGYGALKMVGKPLLISLANMVVAWLGGIERKRKVIPGDHVMNTRTLTEWNAGTGSASETESWVVWVLLGFSAAAFIGISWFAIRWLLSRNRDGKQTGVDIPHFWRWLKYRIVFLLQLVVALFAPKRRCEPVALYCSMLTWGRRSGVPKQRSETPREYGYRLKERIGTLSEEIDIIVSSFHLCAYGQMSCDEQTVIRTRRALRRLRSPVLWPRRAKLLFLSGE